MNCGHIFIIFFSTLQNSEGTDASPEHIERDNEYALSQQLTKYNYVLHPRHRGFTSAVESMQAWCPHVYDLTIRYLDRDGSAVTPSPSALAAGDVPQTIHISVKRYAMEDVLREIPANWLKARFLEKEEILAAPPGSTSFAFSSDGSLSTALSTLSLLSLGAILFLWFWRTPLSVIIFAASSIGFGWAMTKVSKF